MKNFVSFNIKAKKKSDADPMILHLENPKAREKSDNILFPENSILNISSEGILEKYNEVTERIEEIKGKKIQKNANHYLEGVLAFSFEKYNEDPEKFRSEAPALIKKYMNEIAEKYHFEPLGYSLHFDEGSICEETGEEKINIHAHISFINYDFKTNKARFREIQQKYNSKRKYPNEHFMKMQDLAGECFKSLGFKRGVEKQQTKTKHLEKVEFVEQKLKEKEKKIEELQEKIGDLELDFGLLESDNEEQEKKLEEVKKKVVVAEKKFERLKKQGYEFIKQAFKIVSKKLKGMYQENEKDYKNDINDYSKSFIDYSNVDKKIAEDLHKKNKEHFDEQIKKDIDENIKRKSRHKPKPKNI